MEANTCCSTITLPDFGAGSHALPIPFEVSWRLQYRIETTVIAGPIFFTSADNPVTIASVQAAIDADATYQASNTTITVLALNGSGLTVEICKASTRQINDRPSGEFAYNSSVVDFVVSEFTCNIKKKGTGGGFFYHTLIYVPKSHYTSRVRPDSGYNSHSNSQQNGDIKRYGGLGYGGLGYGGLGYGGVGRTKYETENNSVAPNTSRVKYETEVTRVRPDSGIMYANKLYNLLGETQTDYVFIRNDAPENLYYPNGNPVRPTRKQKCSAACLEAYPKGSQYYGYYYCNKNCASATF